MFLQVPSIDSTCFPVRRVYMGSIFFSLVLILRIPAYLGIKGEQFFSDRKSSNFIRSICTKFDTNSLHTNSLHSILHKNWTFLRKIGHVIQIVVHQFVHKRSAEKKSQV
jgi:hypothetical protein